MQALIGAIIGVLVGLLARPALDAWIVWRHCAELERQDRFEAALLDDITEPR